MATIVEDIQKIIMRFMSASVGGIHLTLESRLNEIGVDSPRMIDIILDIEDLFGITINDSDYQKVRTVGDLVDLVSRYQTVKGQGARE